MGKVKIDRCEGRSASLKLEELWHDPESEADPNAVAAILFSEFVTIGPGDLYTSVVTNLVIKHIREAIQISTAKKIYICNLMTKPGETYGMDAADHLAEIVKYLGGDYLDFVIISNSKFSKDSVEEYAKMDQEPVALRDRAKLVKMTKAKLHLADIGSKDELVRHDSQKLRDEIEFIVGI